MNSTFSWNGWQYYLTKTGKPKRRKFIMGSGWQKAESISNETYTTIAKEYKDLIYK